MVYCAAFKCREKCVKGGQSFHCFPKDPDVYKLWVKALKRKNYTPSKYSKLCGKHFSKDCFSTSPWSTVKALKPDAVPMLFDFAPRMKRTGKHRKPRKERENPNSKAPEPDEASSTQVMKSTRTPKKKWSEGVTRLFISKRIKMEAEFKGASSKEEKWAKLGEELGPFSGEECRAKWAALAATYRKNRARGKAPVWPHFQAMDDHFNRVREEAVLRAKKRWSPHKGSVYRGRKQLAPPMPQGNETLSVPERWNSSQELIPPQSRQPKVVLSRLKFSDISLALSTSLSDSPRPQDSKDSMESSTQGLKSLPNFSDLPSRESTLGSSGVVPRKPVGSSTRDSIIGEERRTRRSLMWADGGYGSLVSRIQVLAAKHSRLLETLVREEERRHRETMGALRDIADAINFIGEVDPTD